MKRRYKALLALAVPLLLAAVGWWAMTAEPSIADDSWLFVQLGAELPDRSEPSLLAGDGASPSVLELRRQLRRAAKDDRIEGLLLHTGSAGVAAGRCEELSMLLDDFVAHGKPVTVIANTLNLSTWIVASHANKIVLHPAGSVDLRSPAAMIPFFGAALRKFGITPDILRHGEHKGIYEQFALSEPSAALAEELQSLHDATWQGIRQLCQRSLKSVDTVLAAAQLGPMSADEALAGAWVDTIEEDVSVLEEMAAQGIEVVPSSIYQQVSAATVGIDGSEIIAVLSIEGTIAATEASSLPVLGRTQGIETLRRGIEEIEADASVRGVVVRIESPGGDAFTSEQMWQAITRLASQLPTVVLMGSQATSGGYYAAVASPAIYSYRSTITGSIGIVGLRFLPQGLLQRLEIHPHVIREAEGAAASPWEIEDDASRQLSLKALRDAYELFVLRVEGGREFDMARTRELADGRVYRGEAALREGLVDGVGGWNEAWQHICKDAGGLDPQATPIEIFPRPEGLLARLSNAAPGNLAVTPEQLLRPLRAEQRWYLGPILGW